MKSQRVRLLQGNRAADTQVLVSRHHPYAPWKIHWPLAFMKVPFWLFFSNSEESVEMESHSEKILF